MSKPRKQHYVPQIYLNKFSFSNKDPYKIFALHKDKKRIFCVSVKDAACERNFYTINKSEDKYLWERIYAEHIEPLMSNVLSAILSRSNISIIQNSSSILTQETKQQLVITMVCQLLRGIQSRGFERKLYSDCLPSVIKELQGRFDYVDESADTIIKNVKEDEDLFKIASYRNKFDLQHLNNICNLLIQRSIIIFKIIGEGTFITSDNPIMLFNSKTLDSSPFKNGLIHESTVAQFPISPKVLIAAYHPNFFGGVLREYDGRIFLLDSQKDRVFIENHNIMQYEQCYNQIYADNKTVIEKVLNDCK